MYISFDIKRNIYTYFDPFIRKLFKVYYSGVFTTLSYDRKIFHQSLIVMFVGIVCYDVVTNVIVSKVEKAMTSFQREKKDKAIERKERERGRKKYLRSLKVQDEVGLCR